MVSMCADLSPPNGVIQSIYPIAVKPYQYLMAVRETGGHAARSLPVPTLAIDLAQCS